MKKSIFQELVEESIVLLKNEEQILPLKEKKVAFLGRAQIETIFSGNGSGASKSLANKNLLCECEKRGICAEAGLKQFYTSHQKNESEKFVIDGIDITNVENMNCGFMYEIFGKYQPMWTEYHIPEQLMQKARGFTDTAVFVLGRNAGGEECDRHIEGDYELTESEKELLEQVCCVFPYVIVVLNINGMIDMQWVNAYSAIKAVVFLGIPGEEGCGALADILTGAVNPSGKLSFSMAESFKDYPTAENFTWNKEQEDEILTYENYGLDAKANGSTGYTKSPVTVYQEDIYLGYRYFDTFRKQVLYPFGYGMSYTSFTILPKEMKQEKEELEFITEVTNSGNYAGKETIQLYLSCSGTESEKPEKELKGFAKTRLLAPGEKQNISIRISMQDLAGYVETSASYILEKGKYKFFIGNSSRETIFAGEIQIREDYIIKKCVNRLCVQNCNVEHLQVLSAREGRKKVRMHEKKKEETDGLKEQERYDLLRDEMEQVKNFSIEQLAALCVGYGPGIPFAAFSKQEQPETILDGQGNPLTKNDHPVGAKGYVSPAMPEKGIHSIFYKDGPAGVGTGAWPTAMLISCAFNKEL
ncbi:glycoside hydrolase family 3 C-terminal domain-containing protein [Fusicatenibacter saccharivorans]|uniref:glycoside hydrolase family 3 C-terminal domain-containing protein n=1 Tax=Fusicatenibacter saccharivorans TaxID=1150298 RepID=UPI0034A51A2E